MGLKMIKDKMSIKYSTFKADIKFLFIPSLTILYISTSTSFNKYFYYSVM
jgi:hypothetical protein